MEFSNEFFGKCTSETYHHATEAKACDRCRDHVNFPFSETLEGLGYDFQSAGTEFLLLKEPLLTTAVSLYRDKYTTTNATLHQAKALLKGFKRARELPTMQS